jgi:multiple sugar transport system ATP-binding protein
MAALTLRGITKSFGTTHVLSPIDLDIADGEFLTLVGPSGCGKSTLLRIVAGLEQQDAGTVAIGGQPVDHLRPHERRVAMVFQSYALYPHMSVFENIALPLTMARLNVLERMPLIHHLSPRRRAVMQQITSEVKVVAEQLRIEQYFARRPAQLSGGQRQRVALGRAMVRHPDVFLMDEPLSNLDAKLRVHMRSELAELHARLGVTMVYVTHDQVEAMTMADRLAVMDQGAILQLGTPTEVYERPASVTVAQFIGSPAINLLPATAGANGNLELLGTSLPMRVDAPQGSALTVGVRPEAVHLRAGSGDCLLPCRFRRRENLGSESILHFDLVAPTPVPVLCKVGHGDAALDALNIDGPTMLAIPPAGCHVFGADGMRLTTDFGGAASTAAPARERASLGQPS